MIGSRLRVAAHATPAAAASTNRRSAAAEARTGVRDERSTAAAAGWWTGRACVSTGFGVGPPRSGAGRGLRTAGRGSAVVGRARGRVGSLDARAGSNRSTGRECGRLEPGENRAAGAPGPASRPTGAVWAAAFGVGLEARTISPTTGAAGAGAAAATAADAGCAAAGVS